MLTHLFFDFDRTIWDFERASKQSLQQIFTELGLQDKKIKFSYFLSKYKPINEKLWNSLRINQISKEELRDLRFLQTFQAVGIHDPHLANTFSDLYLERTSSIPSLFPNVKEVLESLAKSYRLHIITNGFQEAQEKKIQSNGIAHLFDSCTFPETSGCYKPDPKMLSFAAKGIDPNACMYIGDSYQIDMVCARNAGWRHALFNNEMQEVPDPQPTFEFHRWADLEEKLRNID